MLEPVVVVEGCATGDGGTVVDDAGANAAAAADGIDEVEKSNEPCRHY